MFDLTYTLTFEDYKKFLAVSRKRNRKQSAKRNRLSIGFLIVLFAGLFFWAGEPLSSYLSLGNLAPLIIIGVALVLFLKFGAPKLWRKNFESQQIGLHPIHLQADDTQLRIVQNGLETKFDWDRLIELTEGDDHLFLWLSQVQSMIIPRSAFASPSAAKEFSEFVRTRMHDTQQQN